MLDDKSSVYTVLRDPVCHNTGDVFYYHHSGCYLQRGGILCFCLQDMPDKRTGSGGLLLPRRIKILSFIHNIRIGKQPALPFYSIIHMAVYEKGFLRSEASSAAGSDVFRNSAYEDG